MVSKVNNLSMCIADSMPFIKETHIYDLVCFCYMTFADAHRESENFSCCSMRLYINTSVLLKHGEVNNNVLISRAHFRH